MEYFLVLTKQILIRSDTEWFILLLINLYIVMNRSGVKERRNDAAISPEDDEYEENEMAHRNFVNKARAPIRSFGDISHKRGAVSFNLGRIVPKNIAHDKEYLYE